jgi:hypothetical protein
MAEINARDAHTMYANCLVIYNNKVVKVKGIDEALKTNIIDLETGRSYSVNFNRESFRPIVGRIGYVNHNGHAFYVMRKPSRVYKVGLSSENMKVTYIRGHRPNATLLRSLDKISNLTSGAFVNAVANDYPTLAVAIRVAKGSNGSCAFDKQFAVDFDRNIYYKGSVVGSIPARCSTKSRIEFLPQFHFLSFPLEATHENTPTTFEAA